MLGLASSPVRGDAPPLCSYDEVLNAAARAEYANKAATPELVDRDSRLGWEPSMDYIGGRAMIEWSMEHMKKAYGL